MTTPFITPLSSSLASNSLASNPFSALSSAQPDPNAASASTQSFGATLMNALADVNKLQTDAGGQAKAFALGQTDDIHSVMIASQKATVALQMTTQVRNKILDAYQSVMQMTM